MALFDRLPRQRLKTRSILIQCRCNSEVVLLEECFAVFAKVRTCYGAAILQTAHIRLYYYRGAQFLGAGVLIQANGALVVGLTTECRVRQNGGARWRIREKNSENRRISPAAIRHTRTASPVGLRRVQIFINNSDSI